MANIICVNCMKGTLDVNGVCSACKKADADLEISRRHLVPRTILKGKYLVGKVIGEGGFGITYIGYDLDLEIRVAIKEFCPRDFAARDVTDGLTILPFDRESAEFFQAEKEKFINEAKRLGKFRGEHGIVSVQDYFQENGTAYIVMEYIDGITLKSFQSMIGTSMEIDKVLHLMKPVMEGLAKLHENGVIHRDISPDNIMIDTAKEKIYLIDFGTAREVRFQEERSLSVYKKGGYTPIEQQTSHGKQGPWTDVYALCATIYRCITGKSIPEVNNRLVGDELIKPSAMGIAINAVTETALLHGLAIKPEERTQNMEQLMKELYAEDPKPQQTGNEYKAPVTEELTVTKQDIAETVSDEYKEQQSLGKKRDAIQLGDGGARKVSRWILIIGLIVGTIFLIRMLDPSRNNYKIELGNGLTKYVEYQTKNDYTETWKDELDNVVETRKYEDGHLVSGTVYEESGLIKHVEYQTENDYTMTWKDEYGNVVEMFENNQLVSAIEYQVDGDILATKEYRNGQIVSKIDYGEYGYTKYYDYETEDDYTITWKDSWGHIVEIGEYRNGQLVSAIEYQVDGDILATKEYRNGQIVSKIDYGEYGYTKYYNYETEGDYTITWKDYWSNITEIREYRNGQPISGIGYEDDGDTRYIDYETKDDYTITWKNSAGRIKETKEYRNGEPVEGIEYYDDGTYGIIDYLAEDVYWVYYYDTKGRCYGYRKYVDDEMVAELVY